MGDPTRRAKGGFRAGRALDSQSRTQPPEGGTYAGGWAISDELAGIPGPVLAHQGSNTLWLSTVFVLPSQDAAFVCNTNAFSNESTEGCVRLLTELLVVPSEPESEED